MQQKITIAHHYLKKLQRYYVSHFFVGKVLWKCHSFLAYPERTWN